MRDRRKWWLLRSTLCSLDHFRGTSNSRSAASTAATAAATAAASTVARVVARVVARAVASFAIISRCHERTVVQIWCTMQ